MASLLDIPGLGGYLQQNQINRQADMQGIQQAGALSQIMDSIRQQQQAAQVRGVLAQSGGDLNVALPALVKAGNISGALQVSTALEHQAQVEKLKQDALQKQRQTQFYTPENMQQFYTPGSPGISQPPDEIGGGPGLPPTSPQLDPQKLLVGQMAAGLPTTGTEAILNHRAQAMARADALQARLTDIETRSQDRTLTREQDLMLRTQADETKKQLAAVTASIAQGNLQARQAALDAPHAVVGLDKNGNQVINWARPSEGQRTFDTRPIGFANQDNINLRGLQNQFVQAIRPAETVLSNYAKFQAARQSGDNSQTNQMLGSLLIQMSRSNNSTFKGQLEEILGGKYMGGSLADRVSNFVSQEIAGRRTPVTDQRILSLADNIAKSQASYIGDQITNSRSTAQARHLDPEQISGPRIYGNIVIWPTGEVRIMKDQKQLQDALTAYRNAHNGQ